MEESAETVQISDIRYRISEFGPAKRDRERGVLRAVAVGWKDGGEIDVAHPVEAVE